MTKCTNCMRGDCCGGDFDELKQQLETAKDERAIVDKALHDRRVELAALREASSEAKDLLWKMQSVQPYSDDIHYVGGKLNAALKEKGG